MSSSCPMVAHSPPHINYVLVMCKTLLNKIINLDYEQCPIALHTTVLQNHTQYNHNQVLIESKLCINVTKPLYQLPHVVLDKTFIRSSNFVHLLFKEVMCGMNDNLESNNRPRNLASPMIGICVPFRYSSGSKCCFHSWQKWTHIVLVGET